MNENINGLFFPKNRVGSISGEEISQLNNYWEVTDAFSRMSYMSVYIIDYYHKNFEYVSQNPLFLCGLTAEEVRSMGFEFYFKYVKKDDLELLLKIDQLGFDFYKKIPMDEKKWYTISCDFHLLSDNKPVLVNHKLTPIFLTKEGKIWKALCVVSLSTHMEAGNITISKCGSGDYWSYDIKEDVWRNQKKVKLTERERDILRYYAQGYSINGIADKIFISPDTIKFHRRKLFEKIQVSNISEALSFVKNNQLL
ncbi:DNA-binding response regulator [Chryseobacterium piperi]|nr:LuxR C-terminal-related transcriptional regulator [Chryseobacterium piperi]ASW76551.1 DNA-binding response regulator [Chryseobacterium piperi]